MIHERPADIERTSMAIITQELADLAVTATEKIVLTAQGDPYELFLNLAEKGVSSDERAQ